MIELKGIFQITGWHEEQLGEDKQGVKQCVASVTQEYEGDLQGNSHINYLMHYDENGDANFVGFETVNASLDTESGVLVLRHSGKFEKGKASGAFSLVSGQAGGAFTGLVGEGKFESLSDGKARYKLTLDRP